MNASRLPGWKSYVQKTVKEKHSDYFQNITF